MSAFPTTRLRRLRRTNSLRRLCGLSIPGPERFFWPVFVTEGNGVRDPIEAMPGQMRYSIDTLIEDAAPVLETGVAGLLIFGLPDAAAKDPVGTPAFVDDGIVQRAVSSLRAAFSDALLVTDVCLCAYTDHGHCGQLSEDGYVCNDATNALLARVAVSHAEAGADIVAPSAMMDGQVRAIRQALDETGHSETLILGYSTKFASAMYGPFRDAEKSAPQSGDRQGYQAPYTDLRQALRESELDEQEGADLLMVKPALFYLDVIAKLRERTDLPIAAYNVSGEYAMLHASADRGWGELKRMVRESTVAIARAGADIIISYWAKDYNAIFKDE